MASPHPQSKAQPRTQSGNDLSSETNIIDTFQSLTVAFALAMTVRSFVTEGFVIPTGSMAPTLLGAHATVRSPETGYEYTVDTGPIPQIARNRPAGAAQAPVPLVDPMIHPTVPVIPFDMRVKEQMGDRVLVLKFLYLIQEPRRWEVVVFKNPTDPVGDTQNFIKRLIGLPNEQLLTVDGDIWTAPLNGTLNDFRVQRKPEHIQRAVWQPVHNSDYVPVSPDTIKLRLNRAYDGPPWIGANWDTSSAAYRCETAEPTELTWRSSLIAIDDRSVYNAFRSSPAYSVSDIRVAAAIDAADPTTLATEFKLEARSHLYTWAIADGKVTLTLARPGANGERGEVVASAESPLPTPAAGSPYEVEFWHVDQEMSFWMNGVKLVSLPYDQWTIQNRIAYSFPGLDINTYQVDPVGRQPDAALMSWKFSGSPLTLHRVRVDRDLYYRPVITGPEQQCLSNGDPISGLAFGTDIAHPARLEEDQFLMMGDNSAYSRDGRLWGRPHPLVQQQLQVTAPFVVPRELLLGPAWSVYFPAPLTNPKSPDLAVIPNFGSVRFIR